jgi:hypothetical protein
MSARPRGIHEETLLRVPGASVHLMAGSDGPVELARGDLAVVRLTKDDVAVATAVRVGKDLGWPLARDEPVVKLDRLHYLFTLPDKDGTFLNYGVSFNADAADDSALASLDGLLRSSACFSAPSYPVVPSKSSRRPPPPQQQPVASDGYWNEFAPRMEGYNGVLAKAIAAGTGQLVKGIFMCSEAYASQVLCTLPPPVRSGKSRRPVENCCASWLTSRTIVACRFREEPICFVLRLAAARGADSATLVAPTGAARRAPSVEQSTRVSRGNSSSLAMHAALQLCTS